MDIDETVVLIWQSKQAISENQYCEDRNHRLISVGRETGGQKATTYPDSSSDDSQALTE